MKNNYFKYLMFCIEIQIMCVATISSKILDLEEGEKCETMMYDTPLVGVCRRPNKCASFKHIKLNRHDICSFIGELPIICCLLDARESLAVPESIADMICDGLYYNESAVHSLANFAYYEHPKGRLGPVKVKYTLGGKITKEGEFPHMAIIGYGKSPKEHKWGCGGSLISERWILTAAHCQKNVWGIAKWARLGDLDIASTADKVQPLDCQISQHILHPNYTESSRYHDIALFRLSENVRLSKHINIICLNTNQSLNPPELIATGWGRTALAQKTSDILLKVKLDTIPWDQCNNSYFSDNDSHLKFGITPDSMICAGSPEGDRDTCVGDSGGPLQFIYNTTFRYYLQVGIVSFGKYCGDKNYPGVYTRVSNYIPWIEGIVWPQDE